MESTWLRSSRTLVLLQHTYAARNEVYRNVRRPPPRRAYYYYYYSFIIVVVVSLRWLTTDTQYVHAYTRDDDGQRRAQPSPPTPPPPITNWTTNLTNPLPPLEHSRIRNRDTAASSDGRIRDTNFDTSRRYEENRNTTLFYLTARRVRVTLGII